MSVQLEDNWHSSEIVSRVMTAATANIKKNSIRQYSYSAFYSLATEQDNEIEDELAQVQRILRDLKSNISLQSKNNFLLERDVRFLDSRIALLIQNRMALDEHADLGSHIEEANELPLDFYSTDNRKMQQYGNLFFLLQSEPRYIASLCRLVNLSEIDTLLQTVMFTLYGNQYESREENLLLTMFQNVLAAQFEAAIEFGSLLRANTPVSRMLTTYTRRGPGQTYLKSVLSEKINQLIEKSDINLQINPLKVYDEIVVSMELDGTLPVNFPKGVTPEIAAANSQVQTIIGPRISALMEIANQFLSTIIESLDQVPYGIRWVCKQIRSLTRRKYPEATDTAISSLIGGFFFLRFINPAIVTPQAYMLIDSYPSLNPRTTLTMVAKMLQNLANKPTYTKESFMIPTNPFVKGNKKRIHQFLNDLCEVSDFYESLEMDQYMALSRKDIYISITPNELYSTQKLLCQHLDTLAPEPKHHLRILLNDLGLANTPKQLPRQLNRPIQLPLFGRWDTSSAVMLTETSNNSITQNDIIYMETKSILVQIIRSLPTSIKTYTIASILNAAQSAKDPQLVSKGFKAQNMLQDLEEAEIVSKSNQYQLLIHEIKQELVHLGDLKNRVVLEIESLEQVHKTIKGHNQYLQSQLESYKAYLQNVRLQSGNKQINKSGLGILKTTTTTEVCDPQKSVTSPISNSCGVVMMTKKTGPIKFSHQQLEKDGVIIESEVPDFRRPNIFLMIQCPVTGTFIISLHYKGREKPILEIDLKLDDLLEKQKEHVQSLDLEYVKLNINKILQLLNKSFKQKSSR
ncbi:putative ras GTPase-activating protein sar1 [Helicostylum pulchrum]|nr:putative ras GTPase-activating protein sar1 [Helicostylum pulchrum]